LKDPIEDIPDDDEVERDRYDDDDGYLMELEDIASVAWEAVRAYRATKGNHTVKPWMHATQAERHTMVRMVQQIIIKTGHVCGDPEHQLIYAVVQTLAQPA
jgi:hypothetical protein